MNSTVRIIKPFGLRTVLSVIVALCVSLPLEAAEVGGSGAANGWTLGSGGVVVDTILDEDGMSSDDPNALATQQSIKAYVDANAGSGGTASRWTDVSAFTRQADSAVEITADDCTAFQPGTSLRFSADEATWFYGVVTTCSDIGATVGLLFAGAPMTTARDDYLQVGVPDTLKTVQLVGVGNAAVSDTWFPKYLWGGLAAYFVRISLYVDTAPVGSALTGNVEIDGTNALDTEFSVAVSGTSTDSGVTLDDSTYSNTLVEQDEFVEIDISQVGSTTPGGNAAWAKLYFIIP